jgi:hypothetical protein
MGLYTDASPIHQHGGIGCWQVFTITFSLFNSKCMKIVRRINLGEQVNMLTKSWHILRTCKSMDFPCPKLNYY